MIDSTLNGQAAPPRDYARAYAKAGLSVVPIRADGSKAATISWGQCIERAATVEEVDKWFIFDNSGIAIAHGPASGKSECIDIDDEGLAMAFRAAVWKLCPGLWERLCCIETPRPGYHLIYRCDVVGGNEKLARDKNGATLIETRGEGGYSIAPGSPAECHESGRLYQSFSGPELTDLQTIKPEERQLLFQIAATFDEIPKEETPPPEEKESRPIYDGTSPGDEFNRTATWQGILTPHGWMLLHTSGDIGFWRRPGKTSGGHSATTGLKSAAGNELFCVFSTNAHPFEAGTGGRTCGTYNKFACYTLLNHGGDFKAAARELGWARLGDRPERNEFHDAPTGQSEENPYQRKPPRIYTFSEMQAEFPGLNEPIIDGLMRRAEVGNVISATKVGKSWGMYGLGISMVCGWDWLGRFPVAQGKVLLVDNELHPNLIRSRLPKVGAALAEQRGEFWSNDVLQEFFHTMPLRSNLRSWVDLEHYLQDMISPGEYQLVIFDAKYRFADGGKSENDNAAEAEVYNTLSKIADGVNSAVQTVHHSSKGNQSEKRVTDVGAGAGSQSRAADCHLVLREHEEESVFVLDAAVRSFAPVEPLAIEWQFPLWVPCDADPQELKCNKPRQDVQQEKKDHKGKAEIVSALLGGPATARQLRASTGFGRERLERLIAMLIKDGQIQATETSVHGNKCDEYSIVDSGV